MPLNQSNGQQWIDSIIKSGFSTQSRFKTDSAVTSKVVQLFAFDAEHGRKFVIGTDEAGRGCGAGGVFASAVCFKDFSEELFEKLEDLNDSKKLSPKKREILYDIIKENSINSITVPYFENEELEEPTIIELSEIDNFMICNYNKEFVKNINFNIICFLDSQEYEIEEIKNTIIKQNQNTKILINLDNNYLKELYKIIQKDNIAKNIIPISNDKMMEKGYSYINNTIYCNDKNESYDIIENDCIVNNIVKISVLVSFIIAYNTSQTVNDVVECLNNFQGIPNIIEYTNKINNIKFINNIWAPTLKILTAPLETYDNIYVIFVTNYKQNNFLNIKNYKDKIRKIFLIDIFNYIILNEFSNKIEIEKCNNINDAFEKTIKSVNNSINNTKINEATILLSPVIADKNNFIYYKDYGIKFKKLIEDL